MCTSFQPGTDALACEYCKSIFFPEQDDDGVRVSDEAEDRQCPLCNVALWNATLAGIQMFSCKKCRGMLIPMGPFADLVDQLRSAEQDSDPLLPADPSQLSRRIDCPQCHHRMDTHFYAGPGHVVIDSCDNCRLIWLDQGEIKRIARAPEMS